MKPHTNSFIPLRSIGSFYYYCSVLNFYSSISWYWSWSMLSVSVVVTILCRSLLRLFRLTVCLSFFVFFLISVPRISGVIFCPLSYCPAYHLKATWHQGSPLWFLNLHHRRATPAVHQHRSLHIGIGDFFSRFSPLDPLCSDQMINRAVSCAMCRLWLFMHEWSWAYSVNSCTIWP
jgi:hypothetical protein